MHAVETYEKHGLKVTIYLDPEPFDPRKEYDNLGIMVCRHSRYTLGDEPDKGNVDVSVACRIAKHAESWMEAERGIAEEFGPVIMLPLFLYAHSGITMNTGGFSCRWDSGRVGLIFVTLAKVREEYGVKRVTKALRERVEGYLRQEVKTYDEFLTGEVYGFVVEGTNADGEQVHDSCWGFYGGIDYCREEANAAAEAMKGSQMALPLEDDGDGERSELEDAA